jgi:hypothetical protein
MLVAVWSGVGAFGQDQGTKHDRAPFVEVVNEVEQAEREGRTDPDGGVLPSFVSADAAPSPYEAWASAPSCTPEPHRPLRHLLCVYRL